MFNVLASEMIVPNIHQLTVEAPAISRQIQPGQFVIVRAEEDGERIPLSVSDWDADAGTLTIVFMNVGHSTDRLASVEAGSAIPTVVGPLGKPTEIDRYGTVVCVGGCYGIGSIYPIARAMKERGNRVIVVIEGRSSYLLYWQEKLGKVADEFHEITRDGTRGVRGHITSLEDFCRESAMPIDRVIVNGCTYLLKRTADVTGELGLKTIVSLNPIMIDGTGMCGVCRVTVGSTRRFACVDGPDFDAHEVDWEELLQRRKPYLAEEVVPLRTSECRATHR